MLALVRFGLQSFAKKSDNYRKLRQSWLTRSFVGEQKAIKDDIGKKRPDEHMSRNRNIFDLNDVALSRVFK
jgi:hypothetical protein